MSVHAAYKPVARPPEFLVRMDRWDPATRLAPRTVSLGASEPTRIIAGVSYQLERNLRLLPDADIVREEHGRAPNSFEAANRNVFMHVEVKF